jgi:hypothetical protein
MGFEGECLYVLAGKLEVVVEADSQDRLDTRASDEGARHITCGKT